MAGNLSGWACGRSTAMLEATWLWMGTSSTTLYATFYAASAMFYAADGHVNFKLNKHSLVSGSWSKTASWSLPCSSALGAHLGAKMPDYERCAGNARPRNGAPGGQYHTPIPPTLVSLVDMPESVTATIARTLSRLSVVGEQETPLPVACVSEVLPIHVCLDAIRACKH